MKKKIVITFPNIPFFSGGAELHVAALRENLQKRGYNAEIVELPFKWYPLQHLYEQMLMWKLVDLSESNGEKVDLVIGTKWPSYLARHDNKIIWLIHQQREAYDNVEMEFSQFNKEKPGHVYLQQFRDADTVAIKEAKKVFTISKNVSNRLEQYNGIASEPLYHPPKHYGHYYCEEYGDYVLSVGRLDGLKRLDLMIRAMSFTDKRVNCVIAGIGTEQEVCRLKRLVADYGLEKRVHFLGFVDDKEMLKLYAKAMCVYFAPYNEDYGYITLEAFLSKKPLVTTTDSGGVLEFAKNGESALIEDPDAYELGMAINRLYENKSLARDLGEGGYDGVKDITWDHALDRLMMFSGLE